MLLAHNYISLSGEVLSNQLDTTQGTNLCKLVLQYSFERNQQQIKANIPVSVWGDDAAEDAHQKYSIGSHIAVEGYIQTFITLLSDGKKQTNSSIVASYVQPVSSEFYSNRVILIGNSGEAPVSRQLESGAVVVNLNLAVQKAVKRTELPEDDPCWISIVMWGKTGEICSRHVEKGRKISLVGVLQLDTWTDRTTGTPRHKIMVQAEAIRLLDAKRRSAPDGADDLQKPADPVEAPALAISPVKPTEVAAIPTVASSARRTSGSRTSKQKKTAPAESIDQ